MKIRTGFVSNSSSSSFVMIGIKLDRSEYEPLDCILKVYELDREQFVSDAEESDWCGNDIKNAKSRQEEEELLLSYAQDLVCDGDLIEKEWVHIVDNVEDGAPDKSTILIGRKIAETDSNSFTSSGTMVLGEETADIKVVKKVAKRLGLEDREICLMWGNRCS